jgi:hypothetical protein
LALNPNLLAEAHIQMGRIKQQLDFDWGKVLKPHCHQVDFSFHPLHGLLAIF